MDFQRDSDEVPQDIVEFLSEFSGDIEGDYSAFFDDGEFPMVDVAVPAVSANPSEVAALSVNTTAMFGEGVAPNATVPVFVYTCQDLTGVEAVPCVTQSANPTASVVEAPLGSSCGSQSATSSSSSSPSMAAGQKRRGVKRLQRDPQSATPSTSPLSANRGESGTKRLRRGRKEKKQKLHEVQVPFHDEEAERKRVNAINAKKHRELKKVELQQLRTEVEALRADNAALKEELRLQKQDLQTKPLEAQSKLLLFGAQDAWDFLDDFNI